MNKSISNFETLPLKPLTVLITLSLAISLNIFSKPSTSSKRKSVGMKSWFENNKK